MKVIQILYSGLGGHGSVALSLLEADKENKWQHVLGFLGVEPVVDYYKNFCNKNLIQYKHIRSIPKKPHKSWFDLYKWLKSEKPDAIIAHSSRAALPCILYCFLNKCTLISVEHQPNLLKSRAEWVYTIAKLIFSKKVVLLTKKYKEELEDKFSWLVKDRKISVISNGIDIDIYAPRNSDNRSFRKDNVLVIGMAARFTKLKRQDILVLALEYLNKNYSTIHWKISLAGAGAELENIKKIATNSPYKNDIKFEGYLEESQLIDWLHQLDLYAHASEGETLSTSMLQAMSCGLPLVASNVDGVSNLLAYYHEPSLLSINDPVEFAKTIADLVNDRDKFYLVAKMSRSIVIDRFSKEEMFNKYHQLVIS
ncbi:MULTISPECIES: glycosyltransferase family 4 protein [Halomonadaceae]|uniref:glycosyltransferase family 4 protein n=1 Tax=Halomonadaceae TaxID=28256 RepID=UPI00159A1634|nr:MULTISPECIES: glycosyltransferase family 4 protein [Halomonas]QJQ94008.1 glycosyltransferase family 4 protein [Halomonas sp. PA5]